MRHPSLRPALRAVVLLATLVLVATGIGAAESAAGARPTSSHPIRPTIVLVHGAWADPSSWNDVVPRLQHDGYRTVTPALALMSVADDVAHVRTVLDSIPGPKILVAHSYGGIVISGAAAGRSDVLGLVFSAAFVPDEGDSIASLGSGYVTSEAFSHLAFTGTPFASPAYIAPNLFRQYFVQDLSARRAALLDAAQQPLNFPIVTATSGPVAWHSLPSWYAVSGQDRLIDPVEERWMATRAGAHTIEFPDASHVGGITRHATEFAALVEHAARAVTSTR